MYDLYVQNRKGISWRWLYDWLVDWFIDWLNDWLTNWSTDWLIDWLIDWQVFAMGKTNRATAITDMNEHSSRSHALLCVTVIGVNRTTGHRTTGNNQFDCLKSLFATYSVICVVLAKRCARAGQTGENLKECRYARGKTLCFNLTSFRLRYMWHKSRVKKTSQEENFQVIYLCFLL